jgi:Icc-related predicted phosphoesterase
MKLQVLSDLHFEVNREFAPVIHPECDVLVLAGDVGIAGRGHFKTGLARVAEAVRRAQEVSPTAARHVLFIPGNHEYDRQDWDVAHAEIRSLCESAGFRFFDHCDEVIEGVRFLGVTLWSDFDLLGIAERDKAMRSASRYLMSTGTSRAGSAFRADAVRELGVENYQWLHGRLSDAENACDKTIVITHFAPSKLSADPRYGLVPATASFCNDYEHLLPKANLWIHGHLHHCVDYWQFGCRVVSNPLGYAKKGEQDAFKPCAVIEMV